MLAASHDGYRQLAGMRAALGERITSLGASPAAADAASAAKALDDQLPRWPAADSASPGLGTVNRDAARYFGMLGSGDARPAATLRAAVGETCEALTKALAVWRELEAQAMPALNAQLSALKLAPIPPGQPLPAAPACGK